MSSVFKPGDKIRCIEEGAGVILNKIYTVDLINNVTYILTTKERPGSVNYTSRFVLAEKTGLAKFIELQESLI